MGNRMIIVALALSTLVVCTGVGFMAPLLPIYAQSVGASGLWLGLIMGCDPLVRAFLGVYFGRLAEVRGIKIVLMTGLVGYAVVALGLLTVQAPWHLLMWRLFQGLSGSLVFPASQAYVGLLSQAGKESTMMSYFNMFYLIGFAIGPLAGGLLTQFLGPWAPFAGLAVLAVTALVLIGFFVPERITRKKEDPALLTYGALIKDRGIQLIVYSLTFLAMVWGIGLTLIPLYVSDHLALAAGVIGMLVSIWAISEALSQPWFGSLADRADRLRMTTLGLAITAPALFLIPMASEVWHLIGTMLLLALCGALVMPATAGISVDRGRDLGMGSVMGIRGAAMGLGVALGSLLGGIGFDAVGIVASFKIMAALGILATVGFALLAWGKGAVEGALGARPVNVTKEPGS